MQGQSIQTLVETLGAEGFYHKVCSLLNEKQLSVDDFSYYELAEACGVLPQLQRLRELMPNYWQNVTLLQQYRFLNNYKHGKDAVLLRVD